MEISCELTFSINCQNCDNKGAGLCGRLAVILNQHPPYDPSIIIVCKRKIVIRHEVRHSVYKSIIKHWLWQKFYSCIFPRASPRQPRSYYTAMLSHAKLGIVSICSESQGNLTDLFDLTKSQWGLWFKSSSDHQLMLRTLQQWRYRSTIMMMFLLTYTYYCMPCPHIFMDTISACQNSTKNEHVETYNSEVCRKILIF